jgi:hypothetical protein
MKQLKAYRLSDRALKHLDALQAQTGANATAVVEMALAFLARHLVPPDDPAARAAAARITVPDLPAESETE